MDGRAAANLADRRRIEGDDDALSKEVNRNVMKAEKIAAPDGEIYVKALQSVDKDFNWWQV